MVLDDVPDPHGVTLLGESGGEADEGGDLVVYGDQFIDPQHARGHHGPHPRPS